jgi:hypothetical protein
MRRFVVAASLFVAVAGGFGASIASIDSETLLDHIKYLASDDMKGRANGSPELERAGDYIAQQFKAAGLKPGGKNGDWFQSFDLIAGLTIGNGNRLTIESSGKKVSLTLGTSYYPLSATSNDNVASASTKLDRLPVVFVGYGLAVPSIGYDDYSQVNVQGKAVLIFSHEPQEHDANSRLNGTRPVPQSTLQSKAALARTHGARVLVVVSDPTHRTDEANYGIFPLDPEAEDEGIPVLRVRRDEMKPLLDAWGLEARARAIDKDLTPRSTALNGATLEYEEHLAKNRRTVRNVIAILPGVDPALAKEAVVIGAHYDHVGLGGHLSAAPERTGEIHNGADDNASGTSSVMEIARVAAAERSRFPRSVVFIAFAGEERGLLGSQHYVSEPVMPIESTVAMLNLDMVGRSRGGVDVSGLDVTPSLEADLSAAARVVPDLEIRHAGPGAGRSDDSSFQSRRIPAINFFTGFHRDYHRPTDDWDKIDALGTARVAALALEFAARIAERPMRPEFVTK